MQAITAPISRDEPRDQPKENRAAIVTNLQEGLLLLLRNKAIQEVGDRQQKFVEGLQKEQRDQAYSDVTQKLVTMFQEQYKQRPELKQRFSLMVTGTVDPATAAALNTILRELGALDGQGGWTEVVNVLNVQGRTLSAINTGTDRLISIDQKIGVLVKTPLLAPNARGEAVRNLHAQLSTVGVVLPVNETNEGIFGVGTHDAVLQLQEKYDLAKTGVLDDATRNALDIAVGNVAHPSRVEGRIFLENGLPAAKIKLKIVNKGFGEDAVVLGEEVETDERGFYALPYGLDGKSANIEIHTFDVAGNPVRLSNPKMNANRNEVLNLVAPLSVQSQTSEFTLMASDLKSIVGADFTKLALAREDEGQQDISLLHQSTGWDARLVASAAIAAKTSAATGISHDALYGVLRAGLPDDLEALAQVSMEAFETALTRANAAGVVALDDTQMGAAKGAFGRFMLETRRTMITPGALSSMGEMLDNARIEPGHKATFQQLALMHDGDDADLWRQARTQGIPPAQIASLQLQGKLAYLTLNNAPLTDVLQGEIGTQDNLGQMVEKDLYRSEQWVARLNALATENGVVSAEKLATLIPSAYTQPDLNARRDAYVEDMACKVRQTFPTQVVNRRIETDELKLGAQHAEIKAPVQMFLKNVAGKGFQLGRVSVDQFIQQHGETVFEGIAADKRTLAREGIKLLTRAYQMTPNDEAMKTLLGLEFTSARQVVAIAKEEFVGRYWERFGSRKVTETVWEKSSQITSVTFNLFTLTKKINSTPPVLAISGTPERHETAKKDLKALLKDYPTMESLFGTLDFCECEHCHSVLSPAAYLVDLLRFVDPPTQDWELTRTDWKNKHNGKDYKDDYDYLKPYDALVLRRPDLPHLPLTCENTNTALPYIDLVNEILEYYVANSTLDANAVHDTGEATSAELMAEPQNVIPKAYDTLKGASYPLQLPFDLWLETTRRFCDYFETPLWHVLDVFRPSEGLFAPVPSDAPPAAYYREQIFAEYLGLSPDEYAIYTNPTFAEWPKLFGYEGDTEAMALAKLKSAKTLSHRLGVSYKELAALVQTAFVNPKLGALVPLRKMGVEVRDVFRYKQYTGYENLNTEDKADFEKRLAQATEQYKQTVPPFDAKQWLNDAWDQHQFEKVLLLRDPDVGASFDKTLVVYSDSTDVPALDFVKLNLFVRLWKRLGWTMEKTDRALTAFLPSGVVLSDATLGNALKTALMYLAHLKELASLINVGKTSRIKLLTLWLNLPTTGKSSLYAQLFLTRNILKDDAVFDHPLGKYLSASGLWIKDHLPALEAALTLTADEIVQILQDGNTGDERDVNKAALSLANVSMLYRYGLLAKALKLSIGDLITLQSLSGLKPFHGLEPNGLTTINEDHPLQHTLAFVRHAQRIKAGGLAVSDLDYLFRHRIDPMGKYQEDSAVQLAWMRTLAENLHTIANDYAVPAKVDDLSDDALKGKMALVFGADVAETFIGFWLNKAVYSATRMAVLPNKRIPAAQYSQASVSVLYDETRQRQQVTHVGVLTSEAKATVLAQIPQPAAADQDGMDARQNFSDLLDEIVSKSSGQFQQFFSDHFDGLLSFDDFFGVGVTATEAEKRLGLLKLILPFLRTKLMRQTIGQMLAAQTGGDVTLVETLLTHSNFLALSDATTQPLLAWFEGLGQTGLLKESFTSANLKDGPQPPEVVQAVAVKAGGNVNSARWSGFIEVPQGGAYRFYARLGKKGASVDLRFDGVIEAILSGTVVNDGEELSGFIELKSGLLYVFTLEVSNMKNGTFELMVKGETTPKSAIDQLVVLPLSAVDGAMRAYTMLRKAVQMAQVLGLTEREVRHILLHPADFGGVDWRLLPTQASDVSSDVNTVALFTGLTQLSGYIALRRDLADGGEGVIAILEQARLIKPASVSNLCEQIATLTRRKPAVVQDVASELKMITSAHFANASRMAQLWQALQIVEKFGVQMASLKKWLTPQPDAAVAMDVRHTIKARYEPEAWQRVAKSIFDPLRQRQRDALVAHIMHKENFVSIEKLFEYFLIDPGMEPVVQTSRLRLAISSIQSFIQRCFLNLEKHVHPSVLNAQHWVWMKRYRVWEANRKIFLFPENWLEPEWRDDKTHLYQELESSLLQGDVTNQLAEDALYVYLKKLDQLARLEIVTMYAEEKPPGPPAMHVIGRTYGLPHQYFYRRYAHQMWTAWEPVTTEIDGEHLVAVMWRERLHVFWLTFMEKVEPSAGGPQTSKTDTLGAMGVDMLVNTAGKAAAGAVKRSLDIQLNWSEYFQGEWTVRESGGFGNAIDLYQPFDASKVFVTVSKEVDPETGTDGAVGIILNGLGVKDPGGHFTAYFRVISKNSRPQLQPLYIWTDPTSPYPPQNKTYSHYEGSGALSVTFVKEVVTTDGVTKVDAPAPQTILSKGGYGGYTLLPSSNRMTLPNAEFAPLITPVFYADDINTFFIEPSLTETTVDKWEGYTITRPSQKLKWKDFVTEGPKLGVAISPKYLQESLKLPKGSLQPDLIDPRAVHTLKPNLDVLTQPNVAMQFGDALIGSAGRVQNLASAGITRIVTRVGGTF
jgi:peptidoglycan hydrolase-like protein with peptidoglycan-binding domain